MTSAYDDTNDTNVRLLMDDVWWILFEMKIDIWPILWRYILNTHTTEYTLVVLFHIWHRLACLFFSSFSPLTLYEYFTSPKKFVLSVNATRPVERKALGKDVGPLQPKTSLPLPFYDFRSNILRMLALMLQGSREAWDVVNNNNDESWKRKAQLCWHLCMF